MLSGTDAPLVLVMDDRGLRAAMRLGLAKGRVYERDFLELQAAWLCCGFDNQPVVEVGFARIQGNAEARAN